MEFYNINNKNSSHIEMNSNNIDIVRSIIDVKKVNGVYEIHPCGDETVSGFIKSENGKLTDFSDNKEYTDYEISSIENFEEDGNVYYKKVM